MKAARRGLKTLVVIPALNEQGKIGCVIARIRDCASNASLVDALVVDDGSHDQTYSEALASGAKVIRHERNRGVGAAIRSGIDYAVANEYEIVAILSGDNQHDPCDLTGLLCPIEQDGYDLVQGSRRLSGMRDSNISLFRRFSTWLYTALFALVTGFPLTDATNGGRAFRTAIVKSTRINIWQEWLNGYELEPYLLFQAVRLGYKVTEAPMRVVYHGGGTTKMRPFRDWWNIFRPLVFLSLGIRH